MAFLKGLKEQWEKILRRRINNFLCKRIISKHDMEHSWSLKNSV